MKFYILLLLAGLSGHEVWSQTDEWSDQEINELKQVLHSWMERNLNNMPGSLRLAFHSCTGGCQGCINLVDPENAGIGGVFNAINVLYESTFPFPPSNLLMSYADFYVLAGIVAVEYGIELNNERCITTPGDDTCLMKEPQFDFVYGREDCDTAPNYPEDVIVGLPNPVLDHEGTMDFFASAFGLNSTEATALLGAHTLGEMNQDGGSGYTGEWKEGEAEDGVSLQFLFNNKYYFLMVSRLIEWTQFNANDRDKDAGDKWQWEGKDKASGQTRSRMLPTDISLVQDIQFVDEGGQSSCEFLECDYAPDTTDVVEFFSNDQDAWLDMFTVAFGKMTTTVADEVKAKLRRPNKK